MDSEPFVSTTYPHMLGLRILSFHPRQTGMSFVAAPDGPPWRLLMRTAVGGCLFESDRLEPAEMKRRICERPHDEWERVIANGIIATGRGESHEPVNA